MLRIAVYRVAVATTADGRRTVCEITAAGRVEHVARIRAELRAFEL
ncbi:hypothetical protein [Gryllotalpicola sp.]|nr:hypothetical protein [Gryllotalpicola sp.]